MDDLVYTLTEVKTLIGGFCRALQPHEHFTVSQSFERTEDGQAADVFTVAAGERVWRIAFPIEEEE